MRHFLSRCLSVVSLCVVFSAALFLQAKPAQAETPVIYKDDGKAIFRINVPDFWSLRTGGLRDIADPKLGELRDVSRVFGMTPDAHPGVWVGMISPHGVSDLKGARDYLAEIGPFLVTDAVLQEPKTRRIAGYPARTVAGQGRRDGKALDFTAITIDLPGNRVAIAVVIFEAGADLEPLGDINRMLTSIRSAR